MPAIAAAPLFWGSVAAGGAIAAGQIVGASKQAGASQKAAQLQTSSANYAADKQSEATQKALEEFPDCPEVGVLIEFIRTSKRGITR